MPFSVTPTSGIDLTAVYVPVEIPPIGPLGLEVFGSDGKRYVFAKAGATIAANTAVCAIDPVTFVVAATGGTYASPATAVANGGYAWFGAASV